MAEVSLGNSEQKNSSTQLIPKLHVECGNLAEQDTKAQALNGSMKNIQHFSTR